MTTHYRLLPLMVAAILGMGAAAEADLRALRAAVRALKPPIGVAEVWGNAECVYCIGDDDRGNVTHSPDCPWAVARALAGEEG